jgi:glycosyltransferase involved in cell wall biosynthesis
MTNGSLRVVHIVPSLFAEDGRVIGGAERYALELARHMANVVSTRIVSFGPGTEVKQLGQLKVRVLGRPWHVRGNRFNPLAPGLVTEVLRADIVHCHQQHVLASSLSALVGRMARRRIFCTEHGGGAWDISAYTSTDRWFHGHLHNSVFSRRVYGRERDPRAHVIYGGVDTERFSPAPSDSKSDRPVLFVGRLLPHKGINYLIEAMPPEMPLLVCGGAFDAAFYHQLTGLARGKAVRFVLRAGDEALINSYRSSLCIVLPSVYRDVSGQESAVPELLGQTLLEGMACGLPAICTNVGAMPEVVEDGVCGFVVPPNDPAALRHKILWLRDHPDEAQRMGAVARRRVLEHFTWPATVRRCLEVYQQCR